MFSKTVLHLFFTVAALSAPMTSAANLRSSKLESDSSSSRNLKVAKAVECTLMVASDARILEGATEHLEEDTYECEMDPEDMGGVSGQTLPLLASQAQLAILKKMFNDGDLIPGESTLEHGPNAEFNRDGFFVPSGLDISKNVRKNNGTNNGRRRLAITTGDKPILVVKVTDVNGLARSENPAQIGDNVFGTVSDLVNLASQMKACSFDQLNIVPGTLPNGAVDTNVMPAPGVIEVTINVPLVGNDRSTIRNAVTAAVQTKLNVSLPGPYQQVMYVLESCYQDCGWAAYAYINSWNSVYQGNYYYMTGVLMHELGHNFNLAHSGGLDGATYTDHTGLMGNPLYSDDVGKMCFNAAKNWQIGWYDTHKISINPWNGPSTVDLVGIANFDTNPNNLSVVVKIETGTTTDQFIGFNRAIGVNSQNDEADDEVTIVETGNNGEGYSQSFLKAHLVQGESYEYANWANSGRTLSITATEINLGVEPAVAKVLIALDGVPTSAPITKSPTIAPVTSPPTSSPSKLPTIAPVTSPPTSSPSKSPTIAPVTSPPTSSPSKLPTIAPVTSPPTSSPSKSPTVAPVTPFPTKAPTVPDTCGVNGTGGSCKRVNGCTWNGGICVSDGSPPTPSPPSPSPPSPTGTGGCNSYTSKKTCPGSCSWAGACY